MQVHTKLCLSCIQSVDGKSAELIQVNTSYAGYTWLGIGQGIMQIYGKAASVLHGYKVQCILWREANVYAVQCILPVHMGLLMGEQVLAVQCILAVQRVSS